MAPRAERRSLNPVVDAEQEGAVTLANGRHPHRQARGDQGCVTLPRGGEAPFFTPRASPRLPDPARSWPMGDKLAEAPLPPVDRASSTRPWPRPSILQRRSPRPSWWSTRGGLLPNAIKWDSTTGRGCRAGPWARASRRRDGAAHPGGRLRSLAPAPVEEWQGRRSPARHPHRRPAADVERAEVRGAAGSRLRPRARLPRPSLCLHRRHRCLSLGASRARRNGRPTRSGATATPIPCHQLPDQEGGDRARRRISLLSATPSVRQARHPAHGAGDGPVREFPAQGYELGTARDWLRLGLLYLQDGLWNGERLLPEGWSNFVRTPAPAWSEPVYGGLFWLNRTAHWPLPEDAYIWQARAANIPLSFRPTTSWSCGSATTRARRWGRRPARALALLLRAVPQARAPWQPTGAPEAGPSD